MVLVFNLSGVYFLCHHVLMFTSLSAPLWSCPWPLCTSGSSCVFLLFLISLRCHFLFLCLIICVSDYCPVLSLVVFVVSVRLIDRLLIGMCISSVWSLSVVLVRLFNFLRLILACKSFRFVQLLHSLNCMSSTPPENKFLMSTQAWSLALRSFLHIPDG